VRILAFGDLHLHAWPRFSRRLPNGMESRTADGLAVLDQIAVQAQAFKPDVIVNLGDTTHRQHAIRFKLYNPLVDAIARLAEIAPTLVLVGNHDLEAEGTSSVHPLAAIPKVTVVDEPKRVLGFHALPFTDDAAQMATWVWGLPKDAPLLAHYGAEGAPFETDYWLDSPLKLDMLQDFPYVLFGHIHKPSAQCAACGTPITDPELGQPCVNCHRASGRVIYVGAPMHFDFGDAGPRSILLIDTDLDSRVRIPIEAPRFVTATWPRVPAEADARGYLRILNVPRGEVDAVKRSFIESGWVDVLPVPAALDAQTRAIAVQGLAVRETTIQDFVRAQPTLDPQVQADLITDGQRWLDEARR
jgi:DNA repair exonuclease SbcCD nuclease subunit